MRCPKCGYISFDRQKSCSRCSNDLTAVAEQLQGTVGKNAAPFFLGAVLGKRESAVAEPDLALREEEEIFDLNELDDSALPEEEAELALLEEEDNPDSVASRLDEDDLEEQSQPSLGIEDIDMSDLVSLEEEEAPALPKESEEEEDFQAAPLPREEPLLMGDIEFHGLIPDEAVKLAEPESLLADLEDEEAEFSAAAEDEDIVDLSSLMDFEENPATAADREETQDIFDLSFGDEPDDLHASPEEGNNASAEAAKKSAGAGGDIVDSGLTLENDEQ